MDIKYIVLDANVIMKDYNLKSHDLKMLLKIKDFYEVILCLPTVVYDECIGNYSKDFDNEVESLKRCYSNIKKILLDFKINEINDSKIIKLLLSRKIIYQQKLDRFLNDNKIIKLGYPNISHQDIVSRIYERKLPFRNKKNSEKGYKDFLIIESIKDYISGNTDGDTVLLTKNVNDFISDGDGSKICPINDDYNSSSLYITSSVPELINKIVSQSKALHPIDIEEDFIEKISDKLGDIIVNNIMLKDEVFGDMMFDPQIKDLTSTIANISIEIDEDSEHLEINGVCKIQFDCDFTLNSFEFESYDNDFVFYDLILHVIEKSNKHKEEFWEHKFYDFHYCKSFTFNYFDFEYNKSKQLTDLDETFLSIYKVN